jgi:hypothetical protein
MYAAPGLPKVLTVFGFHFKPYLVIFLTVTVYFLISEQGREAIRSTIQVCVQM